MVLCKRVELLRLRLNRYTALPIFFLVFIEKYHRWAQTVTYQFVAKDQRHKTLHRPGSRACPDAILVSPPSRRISSHSRFLRHLNRAAGFRLSGPDTAVRASRRAVILRPSVHHQPAPAPSRPGCASPTERSGLAASGAPSRRSLRRFARQRRRRSGWADPIKTSFFLFSFISFFVNFEILGEIKKMLRFKKFILQKLFRLKLVQFEICSISNFMFKFEKYVQTQFKFKFV
jgi:hypothetical protein